MNTAIPSSHVIYDLDGVLLDTEPLYTKATQEIVAAYGKVFGWEHKRHMIGRPAIESARYLVDALELTISAEEYLVRRGKRLEQLFASARAIDGAERFVRTLDSLGAVQAVATSSERRLCEVKTLGHREWFSIFRTIVTGDDPLVRRGKPAPDIFLVAAERIGADPARCWVFEDSPAGVEAARSAGMKVVAIPDEAMEAGAFAGADRVVRRFDEVDPHSLLAETSA